MDLDNPKQFVQQILLRISFIKEMRTILEVIKDASNPVLLFPLFAKTDLIRLTPFHWQLFFHTASNA